MSRRLHPNDYRIALAIADKAETYSKTNIKAEDSERFLSHANKLKKMVEKWKNEFDIKGATFESQNHLYQILSCAAHVDAVIPDSVCPTCGK